MKQQAVVKPTIVSFVNFPSSSVDASSNALADSKEPTVGNFSLFSQKSLASDSLLTKKATSTDYSKTKKAENATHGSRKT